MEQSRRIAGLNLGDVIERYGVALTGAFGVLHDGYKVLPGVNEALQRARALARRWSLSPTRRSALKARACG